MWKSISDITWKQKSAYISFFKKIEAPRSFTNKLLREEKTIMCNLENIELKVVNIKSRDL